MSDLRYIDMCGERIPVVAQRHTRIVRSLGGFIDQLIDSALEIDGHGFVQILDDNLYDAFCALIPKTREHPGFEQAVPRHRFEGFVSQEAYEADEYDPDADEWSPTVPEMEAAMQIVVEVNDLGVLTPKLIDRALEHPVVRTKLVPLFVEMFTAENDSPSTTTANSPSQTGGSAASTSSGQSAPTDPVTSTRSDSPFPVYTG